MAVTLKYTKGESKEGVVVEVTVPRTNVATLQMPPASDALLCHQNSHKLQTDCVGRSDFVPTPVGGLESDLWSLDKKKGTAKGLVKKKDSFANQMRDFKTCLRHNYIKHNN